MKNSVNESTAILGLPGRTPAVLSLCALAALVAGCASAPQVPAEAPIAVKLPGTTTEVQAYLEERARSKGIFRVESASDRALTLKADCASLPHMSAFKCTMVMMAVGNSGWSGPWSVLTFRTTPVGGTVTLSVDGQWCATNAFGKTNCMPNSSTAEANGMLRDIEAQYLKQRT